MNIENIKKWVKDIDKYEAHCMVNISGEEKRESLTVHLALTEKYFDFLWKEKNVGGMMERFYDQIFNHFSKAAKEFMSEMARSVPLFHDLGKINSEFQNRILNNEKIANKREFSCVAGRHSMISAVLYIDYFYTELKERSDIDQSEKKQIQPLIMYHAYVIERHHSDLMPFDKFLESLLAGSGNDVMEIFQQGRCSAWHKDFSLNGKKVKRLISACDKSKAPDQTNESQIALYAYVKLLYSLLVASDFYATEEFMSGMQIQYFGALNDINEWADIFENTTLMKNVRRYQKCVYPKTDDELQKEKDINILRSEMLCDAEEVLKQNFEKPLFYLEAPTGSGKSNTAMDLSFQLLKWDKRLKKIYYIYPFNTLVEQNMNCLNHVFDGNRHILDSIAVINSLTPIKMTQDEKRKEESTEQTMYYQKALLDRQFLNYPMIVSTHVSLFDTMFGNTKESAFGFHQLMNSVIVLDEIQSYKNTLWGEIICFLKEFAYLLNIKVIIMSATLPDLDLLSMNTYHAVRLMKNTGKYFHNPCFSHRVQVSYELLDHTEEAIDDMLINHMKQQVKQEKKIIVEFIKKESARQFYERLIKDPDICCQVEYISGDDSLMERSRILNEIKAVEKSVILVATQVIEAGIDIDMDIGYKNISKLDSEEQFLGRINRSFKRNGVVYFFKKDEAKQIYGEDVRVDKAFSLEQQEIRALLLKKDFNTYYTKILEVLKTNYYNRIGDGGLRDFFVNKVGKMNWPDVAKRMRLIPEDKWSMSVYLARVLEDENNHQIDGRALWAEYVRLLKNQSMAYAEKRVKLSEVTSKMNHFIYQIKRNPNLIYNDKVGEIFYIDEGDKYFDHGKLNRGKLQGEVGDFVDFI